MILKFKKYFYVFLAILVVIGFLVFKVTVDRQKLFSIIKKILNKRDEVEKEIIIRQRLKEENIKKIDREYEKKKAELEKKVEEEFNKIKERGMLDELAIKLFGPKE